MLKNSKSTHCYNDEGIDKWYRWNHFHKFFFMQMNDKNINTQSEFNVADGCVLRINKRYYQLI